MVVEIIAGKTVSGTLSLRNGSWHWSVFPGGLLLRHLADPDSVLE
jgi:hypothetical protein